MIILKDKFKRRHIMANEIVKYRNRLNQIPLRKFNTEEMNIFFSIASRFTEKGTKEITLSFSKLKQLSHFSDYGERFVQELNKLYDKLLAINAYTDDGKTISRFNAFNEYDIKRPDKVVEIAVNEKFKGLFNDLVDNFTRYSLEEFAEIKSTYAKTMFRIIKQFRTTGHLEIKIEDFRNLLDIPKSYPQSNIDHRVLVPIRIELVPLFKNFAYKKLKKTTQGRKVIGYKFTWKPESKTKNDFQSWREHYEEQINNIDTNKFLKKKEKDKARQLVEKHFKGKFKSDKVDRRSVNQLISNKGNNKKRSKQNIYHYRFGKNHYNKITSKEDLSKIPYGSETRTSNEKARKVLDDFKKKK